MRYLVLSTVLCAAIGSSACGISEPIEDRRIGIVDREAGVPAVGVPEQVAAGQDVEVTIRTVGGACVRKGDTEAKVVGDTATVTPYDLFALPRPGFGCLPTAETFQHTATVTFPNAGAAWVVVRVREQGSDDPMDLRFPVDVVP